jgi:hypothetical protein
MTQPEWIGGIVTRPVDPVNADLVTQVIAAGRGCRTCRHAPLFCRDPCEHTAAQLTLSVKLLAAPPCLADSRGSPLDKVVFSLPAIKEILRRLGNGPAPPIPSDRLQPVPREACQCCECTRGINITLTLAGRSADRAVIAGGGGGVPPSTASVGWEINGAGWPRRDICRDWRRKMIFGSN